MPRLARSVCAQVPHHITQRGYRREQVFFTDEDRQANLGWLKQYAEKHEVDVLAYCLMTNHIHLVAVPKSEEGLQQTLKPLHMRYAQGDEPQELEVLRRNDDKSLPCGSERFIRHLEKLTRRGLQYRPQGRPQKEE